MTPQTAIIVPVLWRPWRVEPLLASIEAATPEPYRVVFVVDGPDRGEHQAIREAIDRGYDEVDGRPVPNEDNPETDRPSTVTWVDSPPLATYATKCNIGYRATEEPFIFTAADDLEFHAGWLTEALRIMSSPPYPSVVGTNDLCNERTMRGEHSTHTLWRRSYVDEFGVIDSPGAIFHEGYLHEYADDEAIETAKARGVYAHAFESKVQHLHPLCGGAPDDTTYQRGRAYTARSKQLFQSRRFLWTGQRTRG